MYTNDDDKSRNRYRCPTLDCPDRKYLQFIPSAPSTIPDCDKCNQICVLEPSEINSND